MKITDLISKTTVIHCYTSRESSEILKVLCNLGYGWYRWENPKEDIVYNPHDGSFGNILYYNNDPNWTVIEAHVFISRYNELRKV